MPSQMKIAIIMLKTPHIKIGAEEHPEVEPEATTEAEVGETTEVTMGDETQIQVIKHCYQREGVFSLSD